MHLPGPVVCYFVSYARASPFSRSTHCAAYDAVLCVKCPRDIETTIKYDDLELALEFATSGEEFGSVAYVDGESGQVYYVSDGVDEEYPDDIEENEKYKLVPHKREFGLGKSLAIEFAEEYLPNNVNDIYRIFSSRGAYSSFKGVLEDHDLLEKWYEYERQATKNSLLQWCNEVGITVSI